MKGVVALSLCVLIACDPEVEIENIPAKQLISITCFISPQDSLFTAYLFRASEIGSTVGYDSAAVKDAVVTISDGINYDTLQLILEIDSLSKKKIYKYSCIKKYVNVKAGSTYFLHASSGPDQKVAAFCVIPPNPGVPVVTGTKENNDYEFTINWNNEAFYKYFMIRLTAKGSYENPYPGGSGKIDLKPNLIENIFFPSDRQMSANLYQAVLPFAYLAPKALLKVSIMNIDNSLYKYFISYHQYELWDVNNSGNILPNFKDIPSIYSNIEGGVGVFGSFNSSSAEIIIK